jgi:hypothetical protein
MPLPIQGRYLTRCRYHDVNGGREIEYEPTLHRLAPSFVFHDSVDIDAATGDWVPTPLIYEVFEELEKRGMVPGDDIPGTEWKPVYVWSDPVQPPTPPPDPAPQGEQDAFIQAVQDLKASLTPALIRHWKTHYQVLGDPVVEAAEWVLGMAEKAEGVV